MVHLVRNSPRYASKKQWTAISVDLKRVYTAATADAAVVEFEQFAQPWQAHYPALVAMWRRSWTQFTSFLQFPTPIRKMIYTTNGIESLNAQFRQAVHKRRHFPDAQSTLKVPYLTAIERKINRSNPTGPIPGWKSILNTLTTTYGHRLRTNQPTTTYTENLTVPAATRAAAR
jgi:putative transposase